MKTKIIELKEQGFKNSQIAKKLSCALCTVTYHLKNRDLRRETKANKEEVRKEYEKGGAIKDICKKYGIGETTLYTYVKGCKRLVETKRAHIESLIREGKSPQEIVKETGSTYQYVLRFIKTGRKGAIGKSHMKSEIISLRKEGASIEEVCDKLSVSKTTVLKYSAGLGFIAPRKDSDLRERSISMYKQGSSINEISSSLKLAKGTVYNHLRGILKKSLPKPKTKKTRELLPAIKLKETINKGHIKEQVVPLPNREDKDLGIKVALLYSDVSDVPSKKIEVVFRCQADEVDSKVKEWAKKHNKKSFKII